MHAIRFALLNVAILFFFSQNSQAQNWFQGDERWIFNWNTFSWSGPLASGTEELSIVGDTLLAAKSAKKIRSLRRQLYNTGSGGVDTATQVEEFYMYSMHDSVYYFWDDAYHLVYDFSMQVGDVIWIRATSNGKGFCEDSIGYRLDSIHTEFIAGQNRRIQYLHVVDEKWYGFQNIQIIEGIGMVGHFFIEGEKTFFLHDAHLIMNWIHICHTDWLEGIRFCSFQQGGEEYNPLGQDCQHLEPPVSVDEQDPDPGLQVYPNPFHATLSIDRTAQYPIRSVQLKNWQGQDIPIRWQENEIQLEGQFPAGPYLLQILTDRGISTRVLMHH